MSGVQAIMPLPSEDESAVLEHEPTLKTSAAEPVDADRSDLAVLDAAPRLMLPRIRIDAFVSSSEFESIVGRVAQDRRAVRTEVAVHKGGFKEAVEHYRDQPPANLILIEDHGSADELEWNIETLADCCPPSSNLLVVGTHNDIGLYRRLKQIGVSDYLVQPIRPLDLLSSIVSIFGDADQNELGIVLAFVGTRGGAGASTVAHNVAATLSRTFEATTLLVDADVFGTAALQFDLATPQGFFDALREGENLDGEVLDRLVYWRDKRLGVLAAPDKPDGNLVPDPASLRHLVEQARRLAQFVVLDLPHGWNPWIAEALAMSDRVGLVATPDLPSLRNCRVLLDLVCKLRPNDAPPEIVLNRVPARGKPSVSPADYARTLNRRMAAVIPFDAAAASAEMSGRVLVEGTPASPAATALGTFAAQMAGRDKKAKQKDARKGLMGRLLGRGARMKLPRRDPAAGSAGIEFAIIAPVLILAVLSTADIGLAIHETFEIDQALRNGAEAALKDPGQSRVEAILEAVDQTGGGQYSTTWSAPRYCACPETPDTETDCSITTTCNGRRPTAIFYKIEGVRAYPGIFLPARNLTRSASVQVR